MYPAEGIAGYSREQFIDDLLARARDRSPPLPRARARTRCRSTSPRAGFADQDRSDAATCSTASSTSTTCPGALLRRGARADRRPHLPRRRPRLDAQRRRRLRRAAAEPVPAQGRQLLHRAGGRDGPRARAEDHPRSTCKPGAARLRRRGRRRSIPRVETPEEVRDRVLEAAEYIPVDQLGTTDDCGFSPFCDDTSTTRDTAFAKIRARVARHRARRAKQLRSRLSVTATRDDEEELLRSVALQNAQSILLARQRAEQELVAAKEARGERARAELERANCADPHDRRERVQSVTVLHARASGGSALSSTTGGDVEDDSAVHASGSRREAPFDELAIHARPRLGGHVPRRRCRRCGTSREPRYGQWPHHGMPPGHLPVRSYLAVPRFRSPARSRAVLRHSADGATRALGAAGPRAFARRSPTSAHARAERALRGARAA